MKLTTALPRELRAELGIRDTYGEKKDRRNGPASRKDRRREERSGGRKPQTQVQQRPVWKKNARRHEEEDEDEDMLDEGDESDEAPPAKKSKAAKPEQKQPKSILKKSKPVEESDESDDDDDDIDLDEDEPAPRKVSKAVQDQLQEDDAEIAALEKRLGLKKGKKLPQSFQDDGLDDLLGDLGEGVSEDEGKKRKREADEWLQSKRRKAQGLQAAESEDDDEEDGSELGSDEEADFLDEDDDEAMDDEDAAEGEDSEFGGFDEEEEEEKPAPKKKENPYVAPVPQESQPGKYIPPSLRAASNSEDESLTRLRRQAQGQLNKLSEANLISILAEFEKLYREYPRQNVTSTLISLLMGLICERSALQDTFMILHAGFIAALYKVMGMDFGAELVQKIVQSLDAQGDERGEFEGKEHLNLISLISQLYNFHVIGHALVFDYIRIFVQDITEDNTELLLKVIRSTPPSCPSI